MRWLVTKEKYKATEQVVERIAETNGKEIPVSDVSKIVELAIKYAKTADKKHYTLINLFTVVQRARITLFLMFIW